MEIIYTFTMVVIITNLFYMYEHTTLFSYYISDKSHSSASLYNTNSKTCAYSPKILCLFYLPDKYCILLYYSSSPLNPLLMPLYRSPPSSSKVLSHLSTIRSQTECTFFLQEEPSSLLVSDFSPPFSEILFLACSVWKK